MVGANPVALGKSLDAAVARYVRSSMHRPWTVLVVCFVLLLGAILLGRGLSVNPQLEALLPTDTPSAKANRELQARLRSSAPLYLLARGTSLQQARLMARRLHEEVSGWKEANWVMSKRDPEYFLKNRLLYIQPEDLAAVDDQIAERTRWEQCDSIPGCINMDDDPPPLPTEEDLQALFEKNPDLKALVSLMGGDKDQFTHARPGQSNDPSSKDDATVQLGELCDAQHNVCTVQASIEGDASDLAFASEILNRSEALFAKLLQTPEAEGCDFAVSGQFRNAPMTQRATSEDLSKTSLLSIALVLSIVMLQFRGLRSCLLLAVPVLAGIGWTAGLVALVHPTLNIISAFTLAVLAGVGIDFGVHMVTHYAAARERGERPTQAMTATVEHLLPSLVVAAGTTAAGFGSLAIASFRGFSEMGPIAALGVILSLIASIVILPPLVALLDRREVCPFSLRRYRKFSGVGPRRFAVPLAMLGVVGLVLGGLASTGVWTKGVEFEYDFSKLRPKDVSHGIPWGGTLHGTTRTPVYLLADDEAALSEAAAAFRASPPKNVVRGDAPFLIIPAGFIPPNQDERLKGVAKLSETLKDARKYAKGKALEDIDAFAELTDVQEPVRADAMPRWLGDWLRERDGRFGTLGILYADLGGSDAREMEILVNEMQEWRKRFPHVRFASPVSQLGEVTPRLRDEGPFIFGLALLGVCIGTLVIGRSLVRALFVLVPLAVTVGLSLGAMAVFGVRVNLYNLLVFPLAFGIAVDGAVYVTWALAKREDAKALPSALRAVLGSTLTTMAGFGSLMISRNPGLVSIGVLALLMLGLSLFANLVWLPAVYRTRGLRSQGGG